MVTNDYAIAYKEIVEILKYVPDEDVAKIPQEKIDYYKKNMDDSYDYQIDETKEFAEQPMSDITKAILATIFRDYWATPYQKERILAKEKYDMDKIEEEKRKKYNPDNIFKNKETIIEKNTIEETSLIKYENKSWYKKVFELISNMFRNIFKK